jgi:hypothetical protein
MRPGPDRRRLAPCHAQPRKGAGALHCNSDCQSSPLIGKDNVAVTQARLEMSLGQKVFHLRNHKGIRRNQCMRNRKHQMIFHAGNPRLGDTDLSIIITWNYA